MSEPKDQTKQTVIVDSSTVVLPADWNPVASRIWMFTSRRLKPKQRGAEHEPT